MREPVDQFISDLNEGFETKLPESHVNVNIRLASQQEYECQQLPPLSYVVLRVICQNRLSSFPVLKTESLIRC